MTWRNHLAPAGDAAILALPLVVSSHRVNSLSYCIVRRLEPKQAGKESALDFFSSQCAGDAMSVVVEAHRE